MEKHHIAWNQANIDLEWDKSPVPVVQEYGNRGMGLIILLMSLAAVLLPSIPTAVSMARGTAKGNPLGAIIAVVLIFSWPIYWSIKQFFLVRRFEISDDRIRFQYRSILFRKKYEVPLKAYQSIRTGHVASRARRGNAPGQSGYYYVLLPHKDSRKRIYLYRQVREQMAEERIRSLSEVLGLPIQEPDSRTR